MSIAQRRHHNERMKRKAKYYWYDGEKSDAEKGMIRKTRKPCSGPYCCGNPRRIRGANHVSRQEIIAGIKGQFGYI